MKVAIKNCLVEITLEGYELRNLTERARDASESLEGYITALLLDI